MATATSPLVVYVSAMMDGRALDATTEWDVSGARLEMHLCAYFACPLTSVYCVVLLLYVVVHGVYIVILTLYSISAYSSSTLLCIWVPLVLQQ